MGAIAGYTPASMCPLMSPTTKSTCQETFGKKNEGMVVKIRLANLKIQGVSLVMLKHPLRITHTVTVAYYKEES